MEAFESAIGVWSGGGILLLPLAGVSGLIFAWIFRSVSALRPLIGTAETLSVKLEDCGGNIEKIQHSLDENASWLASVYSDCLASKYEAKTLMKNLENIEKGCVQVHARELLMLSAFTAAAPLLGLLGTVIGMIATFHATASLNGDTGQQIADGISSALITTQFGLVIALPGLVGIAHLQKRIRDVETLLCQCRFLIAGAFSTRYSENSR